MPKKSYRRSGKLPRQGTSNLRTELARHGLQLVDVEGDGNCLFRAVADQIGTDCTDHVKLRSDLVEYFRGNEAEFAPFLDDEEYPDFLQRIAEDGEWGGNFELAALARMLRARIIVHQAGMPPYDLQSEERPLREYHIAYIGGEHYASVCRTDGSTHAEWQPSALADLSEEEKELAERTVCSDKALLKRALERACGDLETAVELVDDELRAKEKQQKTEMTRSNRLRAKVDSGQSAVRSKDKKKLKKLERKEKRKTTRNQVETDKVSVLRNDEIPLETLRI